jgi:hypothetical protein
MPYALDGLEQPLDALPDQIGVLRADDADRHWRARLS